jgi:hypothetical protein
MMFSAVAYPTLLLVLIAVTLTLTGFYSSGEARLLKVVHTMRQYHQYSLATFPGDPNLVPIRNPGGLVFTFTEPTATTVRKVTRYLEAHLQPTDTIFCFPYAVRYNFLLGKVSPAHVGPSLWAATPELKEQRQLVGELERIKPVYVVYEETEWPDTDGVPWTDRFPEIADYIFSRYRAETKIDGTLILRRSTEAIVPPEKIATGDLLNQPYLVRGWFHVERMGATEGRWMSTKAIALLSRRAGENTLTLTAFSSAPKPKELSLQINGAFAAGQAINPGWGTYRIDIPDFVPLRSANTVEFTVDSPLPVAESRLLGVWVKSLGFGPE